ncbi:MAG TPA: DMT family transporter [Candidatus Saccharimonadales bacterium]|nr:DMT family transporter [Candidatus Saccharimonadales bacterium]
MPKTKKQKLTAAFFALSLAEILWGVNVPVIKLGIQTISIPLFLSITIFISGLLVAPLAYKYWKPLKNKDHFILITGSILSISLGNVALLMGLQRIPSVNASLISLLGPFLLFILSVEFLKERLSFKTFVGILIAFAGAAIIIGKPWEASDSNQAVTGSLFVVLAVLCEVISTLMFKPLLKRIHPYQLTSLHMLWGILPIAVYSLPNLYMLSPDHAGRNGYLAMFFNIILITFANCLFYMGLKYKKAQEVGIFRYLHPLATAIAAWFILSEVPSRKIIIGGALIFLGIYYAQVRRSKKLRWI